MRARWVQHDRSMQLPEGAKTVVASFWPGVYYLVYTGAGELEPQQHHATEVFRCYKDGLPKSIRYRFYRRTYETLDEAKAGHADAVEKLAAGKLQLKRTVHAGRTTTKAMWERRKTENAMSAKTATRPNSLLGLGPIVKAKKPDAGPHQDVSAPVLVSNDNPLPQRGRAAEARSGTPSAPEDISTGSPANNQNSFAPGMRAELLRCDSPRANELRANPGAALHPQPSDENFDSAPLNSPIRSDIRGIHLRSSAIRAVLDQFSERTAAAVQEKLTSFTAAGEDSEASQAGAAALTRVQDCSRSSDEVELTVARALTDLSQRCQQLIQFQSQSFEQKLASIAERNLSQAHANGHRLASRLEAHLAQAEELKCGIDANLASLAQRTREATDAQTEALEQTLAKIADKIGGRIDELFNPAASRIDSYRAQLEEMTATLDSKAIYFSQQTADATQAHARSVEATMARISEQATLSAQEHLSSEVTALREGIMHSLEERLASVAEQGRRMLDEFNRDSQEMSSQLIRKFQEKCETCIDQAVGALNSRIHTQTELLRESGKRLGDSIEAQIHEKLRAWSEAQLESIQGQATSLSADLLGRMRAESEVINQHLHERMNSDAEMLETAALKTMQSRFQTVSEELRSVIVRAFGSALWS